MHTFLLCTDLDRTLLPNGRLPESPQARPLLQAFVGQEGVHLAYVTGRDLSLVEEAIQHYALPQPDWLIADVGSSLYRLNQGSWRRCSDWDERHARCWRGQSWQELAELLKVVTPLTLQEPSKQGQYKLSFYHPLEADVEDLRLQVQPLLSAAGLATKLIFSVDDINHIGLLDLLPESADKLCAIRFLMTGYDYCPQQTLFAGDSGNDLEIFESDIASVIVANASAAIKDKALQLAAEASTSGQLYVARGGFHGMNGNYAAGILEGLAHFYPNQISTLPSAVTSIHASGRGCDSVSS
jgi:hypothetical protein